MPETTVNLGVTFPGELLLTKLVEAWIVGRQTQSQATRDAWDELGVEICRLGVAALKAQKDQK